MLDNKGVAAKEYEKMQWGLLLTVACIAVDQTLLGVVILAVFLTGLWLAWKERNISKMRIWPSYLKWDLFILLGIGYLSLHNPLVTEKFACTFNFIYVVGQYTAITWLMTRFGNCFA
ncbi:MAG: hypothetical protein J6L94_00120, partial [Acidaminococcaceae bacterium]|nr:hypothetical protein [Acidaminococcaceae bacterium]